MQILQEYPHLVQPNSLTSELNGGRVNLPFFLFWLGGSIRAPFSILVGNIAALLVRCTLILKNMLDAELKVFKAWLRARSVTI